MLDAAYVEMVLFLNLNRAYIPALSTIPKLSEGERKEAIPERLRHKEDFDKFNNLAPIEAEEMESDAADEDEENEDDDGQYD